MATEERTLELPLNGLAFDQAPQETRPFFSQVLILPVRVASLGLADGQETVTLWVESFSVDKQIVPGREEEPIMRTPRLRYGVNAPVLRVEPSQASPLFALRSGQSLPVNFSVQRALAAPPTRGLLLLHHQNGVGNDGGRKQRGRKQRARAGAGSGNQEQPPKATALAGCQKPTGG